MAQRASSGSSRGEWGETRMSQNRCMHLNAVVLTFAAGAFAIVAACGGGTAGSEGGSGSDNHAASSVPLSPAPTTSSSSGGSGNGAASCQSPAVGTTIIGGSLFVAEQGPIEVTLLSVSGLKPGDPLGEQYRFEILYDIVF